MAQVLMARACLLFLGQMSQRGGGVQPATRPLPRAPRGGDEHPAAHVFRLEQARLERSFVCWGRLRQCGFPVRPISAVATSILPHLGKQLFFSSGVEQPASQHILHQKQAKRRQATALTLVASKCIYHV